jgi:predicted kinase
MQNNNNLAIILIRGLPGSGKSTFAELLSEKGKYPVFSVDDYFTNTDGSYNFNHAENYLAYEQCEEKARIEMQKQTSKIFIDNTFTIDWELQPYLKMAKEYNYRLFVLTMENFHGSSNIHGISDEQMKKMADKYKVRLLPEH